MLKKKPKLVTLIEFICCYFLGEHYHGYNFVTFVNRRIPIDGVFVSPNQSVKELTEPGSTWRLTDIQFAIKTNCVYKITWLNFSSILTASV